MYLKLEPCFTMLAASYITTRRRPTLPLASFPKHVTPWRLHASGRSRFSPRERSARFCRIGWNGHHESSAAGRTSTTDFIRVPHPRSHARSSRAGRRTGGHGERSDKAPQRASHTPIDPFIGAPRRLPGTTGTQLHPALAELKGQTSGGNGATGERNPHDSVRLRASDHWRAPGRRHPAVATRTLALEAVAPYRGIKRVFRESYLMRKGLLGAVRVAVGRLNG